jgi:hypothetical protein
MFACSAMYSAAQTLAAVTTGTTLRLTSASKKWIINEEEIGGGQVLFLAIARCRT